MSLVSICFVGKDNEPLYLRDFTSTAEPASEPTESSTEDPFGFFEETPQSKTCMSCSLHYQFLMHASLDRFEELTGPSSGNANAWRTPGSTGNDAMWVGLLCPVDDFRVYGYLTTTNIKLIGVLSVKDDPSFGQELVLNSTSAGMGSGGGAGSNSGNSTKREAELKTMFANIHSLYVEYTLNPFSKLKSQIVSRRFDHGLERLVAVFNNSD